MGKAQTQTEHPTLESVWAMIQETNRGIEETRRGIEETDRILKESLKETDRIIKENGRQMGYLNNRFGQMIEHLVAPNIKEKFRALGFNFDHISQDHEITDNGRRLTEIDLLLENGDIAIAVEVKSKPLEKDVDEHVHRMEILRRKADARHDSRKLRGAIAGAIMNDAIRNYTHKMGFYLIEQTGDTIRINIPEGFKPREW